MKISYLKYLIVYLDNSFVDLPNKFTKKEQIALDLVNTIDTIQYVAQYPDGTSIRTLETKTQFLRRPFQFSVNEVFRVKAEHFSFKMNVLAI